MTRVIVGIDPGRTGALAAIDDRGRLLAVADMPLKWKGAQDHEWLWMVGLYLRDFPAIADEPVVFVEQPFAMPNQSSSSTGAQFAAYGAILGALGALGLEVHTVTPSAWKRAVGVTADKRSSLNLARQLWPSDADRWFRLAKHDGRAEAALIAVYGMDVLGVRT
jgi:crossover junction endodeoxyribonuclease RuvC